MRIPYPFLLIGLIACGGEDSIKVVNAPPTATITSHQTGDTHPEGYTASFEATVSDPDDTPDQLQAAWYAGTREICPPLPPDSSGDTSCSAVLQLNEGEIRVEVKDPKNAL